jgi:hypothetical protein
VVFAEPGNVLTDLPPYQKPAAARVERYGLVYLRNGPRGADRPPVPKIPPLFAAARVGWEPGVRVAGGWGDGKPPGATTGNKVSVIPGGLAAGPAGRRPGRTRGHFPKTRQIFA